MQLQLPNYTVTEWLVVTLENVCLISRIFENRFGYIIRYNIL